MSNSSSGSASKVLTVLFAFDLPHPRLTAKQISEMTGLNRSTVHRMLGVLEHHQVVRRKPSERSLYELTPYILQLSETYLHQLDALRSVAMSHLTTLRDRTGETAALHFRQGSSRVGIEQVESHHQLRRTYSDLGQRVPIYLGAPGLVMLAPLPREQVERYLPSHEEELPDELPDLDHLVRLLGVIREQGYAVSHAHRLPGIVSIAAPIYARSGDVIAAINITGPAVRITDSLVSALAADVVAAAGTISQRIGYSASRMPQR